MKGKTIILASKRGFCSGVERALKIVDEALKTGPFPIHVLHEIVHNEHVVDGLRARGVRFIGEPEEACGGTLIFSAHGVSRSIEERAKRRGVHLIDATCPIVKNLHRKAEEFAARGCHILLFGKEGHREIEGVLGRISSEVTVLDSENAILDWLATLPREQREHGNFACLSQTTLNADDVAKMRKLLETKLRHLEIHADVCFATRDRQNAVKELAEFCDLILIVGSIKSSNSRRLRETAAACGVRAVLLSGPDAFEPALLDGVETIGVSSGASAPEELLQALLRKLEMQGFRLTKHP